MLTFMYKALNKFMGARNLKENLFIAYNFILGLNFFSHTSISIANCFKIILGLSSE